MTKNQTVLTGTVTVTALLSSILMAAGIHTAAPAPIATPTLGSVVEQGKVYTSQVFYWTPSNDATGYRLYLDGKVFANVNYAGSLISVLCGVQHRFNVQPFNNKGVAKLALPLYFTTTCS